MPLRTSYLIQGADAHKIIDDNGELIATTLDGITRAEFDGVTVPDGYGQVAIDVTSLPIVATGVLILSDRDILVFSTDANGDEHMIVAPANMLVYVSLVTSDVSTSPVDETLYSGTVAVETITLKRNTDDDTGDASARVWFVS